MKPTKKSTALKMLRAFSILVTFFLPGLNFSYAQTGHYIPATIPDTPIASSPYNPINLISNAVYDYGSLQSPAVFGQLKAVALQTTLNNFGVRLDDGHSLVNITVSITMNSYLAGPDVALGTDLYHPSRTNCLLAVVYTKDQYIPSPGYKAVHLAVYEVTGLGSGSMACSLMHDSLISDTTTEKTPLLARIDMIAEYNNLYPTTPPSLPLCDQFAVTWGDNGNSTSGVYGYYGKLNTAYGTGGSLTKIYPPGSSISGQNFFPDIAAVMQKTSTSVDAIGYFAFVDSSAVNNTLYCSKYDFTTGGTPAITTLSTLNMNRMPRIAGVDDPNQTGLGRAAYYVVDARTYNLPYDRIAGFCDIGGTVINTTLSDPISTYLTKFALPAVTTGPDTSAFTVVFSDMVDSNLVAETVSRTTGRPLTFPYNPYYQVNDTDTAGHGPYYIGEYRLYKPVNVAIEASCNTNCYPNKAELVVDWADDHNAYEKGTGSPLVFRPDPTSVSNLSQQVLFTAVPNPVSDELLLSGNVNGIADGYSYGLIDMLGRTLQQQPITQNKQLIDVSHLPNGMYLLKICKSGQSVQTMKVLKE